MNTVNWSEFTGGLTPRAQQIECLERIQESTADIIIVQGPTGVGKSLIMLAAHRYFRQQQTLHNTFLVTPQRTLQAQLAKNANDCKVMMGARNYGCEFLEKHPEDHYRHRGCPYYSALDKAVVAPVVVHNYSSFLHQRQHFPKRNLLCLDEGHRAAEALGMFLELDCTQLHELLGDSNLLEQLQEAAQLTEAERKQFPSKMRSILRQMRSLWWLYGLPEPVDSDEASSKEDEFAALEPRAPIDLGFREQNGVIIPTRLSGAGHLLTNTADKVLVFSATVLDPQMLAGELGLGKRAVEYIELPSSFPVTNRPVVCRYQGKMTQKWQSYALPRVCAALKEDAARHENEPGIIHTVSYALAKLVEAALRSPRVIMLPAGAQRDRTIQDFLAGKLGPNRILVGPGLHEGIDGAGDSVRWQAIVKSPAPYLGDVKIKAIFERNPVKAQTWYKWKTAQTLIQMLGRIVRSDTDYGTTYVYDSSAADIFGSAYCPQYVREALVQR